MTSKKVATLETRLTELKTQNEEAKRNKAKKEGSLEEKMKQLESYGCKTVSDLESLIEKNESEANELGKQIETQLEELEKYDL